MTSWFLLKLCYCFSLIVHRYFRFAFLFLQQTCISIADCSARPVTARPATKWFPPSRWWCVQRAMFTIWSASHANSATTGKATRTYTFTDAHTLAGWITAWESHRAILITLSDGSLLRSDDGEPCLPRSPLSGRATACVDFCGNCASINSQMRLLAVGPAFSPLLAKYFR